MGKPQKPRVTFTLSPFTYQKFEELRSKDPLLPSMSRFGEMMLLKAFELMDKKPIQEIHKN